MKLEELLNPNCVEASLKARTKKAAIEEMVERLMVGNGELDREEIMKALLEREKLGTTGMGNGIAIPHARASSVRRLLLAVGRSREGIPFQALDGKPVYLVFLLLAPAQAPGPHLKALARLARILRDQRVRKRLLAVSTARELFRELLLADTEPS